MEARTPKSAGERLLDGKLEVIRVLGTGGMGTVYEVRHLLTKHHRALKVMHPRDVTATIVKRFQQEAAVAGTLGSEYIVETLDAGQLEDGSFYVLMEMLEGEPLRSYLDRVRSLEPGPACAIIEELCRGLQVAHDAGVIHRDLKPDNIFLVDTPNGVRVKLLDFGISKFERDETTTGATETGTILGTPLYMSPEQLKNSKDVTARTDLYAVGVMLYEMLSGSRPFNADSLPSLLVKIYMGERAPLIERAPELPAELVEAVERAMQLDPSERFSSARELEAAIASFASTIELARPPRIIQTSDEIAFLPTAADPSGDKHAIPKTQHSEVDLESREAAPRRAREDVVVPMPAPVLGRTPPWKPVIAALIVLALGGGVAVWATRDPAPTGEEEVSPPNDPQTSMTSTSEMTLPLGNDVPMQEPSMAAPTEADMAPAEMTSMSIAPSMRDLKASPYPRMR